MAQFSSVLLASLARPVPRLAFSGLRNSSTSSATPSLQLVAELRKRTTVTIQKAREALIASNGDVAGALNWLENDRIATGERKAEKVGGRFAGEGLVGVSLLSLGSGNADWGVRAAMVELNCETDFVGRNELFRTLTRDLAFTAAFMTDPQPTANEKTFLRPIELSHLRDAPLMIRGQDEKRTPKTVSEAIRDTISAVGENISIRRALAFVHDPLPLASGLGLRASSYIHGALPSTPDKTPSLAVTEAQGQIGALLALRLKTSPASRLRELLQRPEFITEMSTLERALSRQVVGLKPDSIRGSEDALYKQAFDMLTTSGGQSVEKVLSRWAEEQRMAEGGAQEDEEAAGLEVVDFMRWEVGEGL